MGFKGHDHGVGHDDGANDALEEGMGHHSFGRAEFVILDLCSRAKDPKLTASMGWMETKRKEA